MKNVKFRDSIPQEKKPNPRVGAKFSGPRKNVGPTDLQGTRV